jgi:hypothetical protein
MCGLGFSRRAHYFWAMPPPRSSFIEPWLPSPAERPPSAPDWVHEIKHDGFRLMARRDPVGIRLVTRNGHDWSPRYPAHCRGRPTGLRCGLWRRFMIRPKPVTTSVFVLALSSTPLAADYMVDGKIEGSLCTSYIIFSSCRMVPIDAVQEDDGQPIPIKEEFNNVHLEK